MSLSLKIFIRAGDRTNFVAEHELEDERVTVGRSKTCTLSLEDPDRCLSRVHAELVRTARGYMLKVLSSTSAVLVNGEPHAHGSEVMVSAGDMLTMDVYDLEIVRADVEFDPDATMAVGARSLRPPSAAAAPAPVAPAPIPPAPVAPAPVAPAPQAQPRPAPTPRAAPSAVHVMHSAPRTGRGKLIGIGAAAIAGVVALVFLWPTLKGALPDSEAQKKAELRIAQLDGEAKSLLKLVEGDRREIKEAVARSNQEVEKIEGQVRAARSSQERTALDATLPEARRIAKLNTALENKVREQAEGPNGLPKAEGNLNAATLAQGKDKTEAVRLLEETVASLTKLRAGIAEDRKVAQAEQAQRREELHTAGTRAIAEGEARAKAEADAKAKAKLETEARAKAEAEAKLRADAEKAKAAAKGAPAPQAAQPVAPAQALKAGPTAQPAPPPPPPAAPPAAPLSKAAQAAQAAEAAKAAKAAQAAEAAKAADTARAAEAAKVAEASKAAETAKAAEAAKAAQAALVASSPCFGNLAGAWTHSVGGTWTFAGNQATQVVNSGNYGSRAQQIQVVSVSSCENGSMTYKVVRLALANTDDPGQAYDKTPANAPALSTWAKVNTQPYSISANGLKFGNYTYVKR